MTRVFTERRFQFFASEHGAGRRRRPIDIIETLLALGAMACFGLLADPASGTEQDLVSLIEAVPAFLDPLWDLLLVGLALWLATVMAAGAALGAGGHWRFERWSVRCPGTRRSRSCSR